MRFRNPPPSDAVRHDCIQPGRCRQRRQGLPHLPASSLSNPWATTEFRCERHCYCIIDPKRPTSSPNWEGLPTFHRRRLRFRRMLPGSALETYASLLRPECFTRIARPLHRCHQPKSHPHPLKCPLRCHPPISRSQQRRAISHTAKKPPIGATHPVVVRQSTWMTTCAASGGVQWVAPSAHHLPSSNRCHPSIELQLVPPIYRQSNKLTWVAPFGFWWLEVKWVAPFGSS